MKKDIPKSNPIFLIDMLPEKRGKKWVVSVHSEQSETNHTLEAEYSFNLKREAALFIDGWVACVETHNRN
jgi:hypothetical protein